MLRVGERRVVVGGPGSGSALRHANEARDGIQFFLPPLLFLVLLVFPLVHPSNNLKPIRTITIV